MKKKKILIDIGHPAQVHQFKYIYKELIDRDYDVLFTTKDKEISLYLLNKYKIPFVNMGKPKKGLLKKILYIPSSCLKFYKVIRKFKPDLVLSRFSFQASWISFLFRIPHIGFTDTEHVGLADKLTVPFVTTKLTAYSYQKNLGKNHNRYSGNIELFYLHSNRFKPDKSILKILNVNEGEKYIIMRFVAWEAHHDVGHGGLSNNMKIEAVKKLSKYAKIFITSEKGMPDELKKYQIKIPPEKMHDALYFSSMYFGDGGTMTSESAVLGVPSVFISSSTTGYLDEEEKEGLIFRYTGYGDTQEKALNKAIELIQMKNLKKQWGLKKKAFLKGKIDGTEFTVSFIEEHYEKYIKKG